MMAVIFLTIFSALAVGFYSTVTMSVQVSGNEQKSARAMLACDSGMQFLKYHLGTLGVPPKTPQDQMFAKVFERLGAKLNNFPNMPADARTIDLVTVGGETVIRIPAGGNKWIPSDNEGSFFRAEVHKLADVHKLEVRVFGRFGNTTSLGSTRGVALQYQNISKPSKIFNFGVASASPISMNGNVTIRGTVGNEHMGSVLSTHTATNVPLTMTGGPEISGEVSFVNPNAAPVISSGASIGTPALSPGQPGFNDLIHRGIDQPEFPIVDTSAFIPFVPGPTATGPSVITAKNPTGTYFKNIRIKAGTNPTFNSNTLIQGVILIEMPNAVKFSGGGTIQGVIVTTADDNNNATANLAANSVAFTGGTTFKSVSTLPATSDFPATLRGLTGAAMLLPGFTADFGGNFNTISGSIIASKIDFHGTAGGVIKGSVINLRDSALNMSGTADIIIESTGTSNAPSGLTFGSNFAVLPDTYEELEL
jgi:hypothetical protein